MMRMRGLFVFVATGALLVSAAPAMAAPSAPDSEDTANCTKRVQKKQVRPMAEPAPVRKTDRERTRRILM